MADARAGWAILGTGRIARRFAEDMRYARRGRIVAVGSRSPDRARSLAAAIGEGVQHGTAADVLRMAEVDAVYVAGPNETHAASALECLDAGKPVLVEKPFATTLGEALAVAEAARGAGCLAMEAMWMRFTPGIRRLKGLVDAGALGRLRALDASLGFANAAPAAGVLLDLGVYPVSLAVHLLGPAEGVAAQAGGAQASLLLAHDGALARLGCSFAAEGANRATVAGERGVVQTDASFLCPSMLTMRRSGGKQASLPGNDLAPRARLPQLAAAKAMLRPLRQKRIPTLFAGSGLQYQADHFAECLDAGRLDSSVMPLAESLEVLRILDAAAEAIADQTARGSGSKLDRGR